MKILSVNKKYDFTILYCMTKRTVFSSKNLLKSLSIYISKICDKNIHYSQNSQLSNLFFGFIVPILKNRTVLSFSFATCYSMRITLLILLDLSLSLFILKNISRHLLFLSTDNFPPEGHDSFLNLK